MDERTLLKSVREEGMQQKPDSGMNGEHGDPDLTCSLTAIILE